MHPLVLFLGSIFVSGTIFGCDDEPSRIDMLFSGHYKKNAEKKKEMDQKHRAEMRINNRIKNGQPIEST